MGPQFDATPALDKVTASMVAQMALAWMSMVSVWAWYKRSNDPEGKWAIATTTAREQDEQEESLAPTDAFDNSAEASNIAMSSYYGRRRGRRGGLWDRFMERIESVHPVTLVAGINFFTTIFIWFVPQLYPWFIADGFLNPLGFVLSGFTCLNPVHFINEIFYFYIVTRTYVSWWTRREICTLYLGGTATGALLLALTGSAYMGPTAGSAAILTAFLVRNREHPVAIWPFVDIQFRMQTVGIGVGLLNLYLLYCGAAVGAAFLGGALFAAVQYYNQRRNRRFRR